MVQAKINRELANLGADPTSIDMSKTITNDENEEALAGAAATFSPLSPTNNSASKNLSHS